eukprot:17760-Heterococcus_DN1.PRE.3
MPSMTVAAAATAPSSSVAKYSLLNSSDSTDHVSLPRLGICYAVAHAVSKDTITVAYSSSSSSYIMECHQRPMQTLDYSHTAQSATHTHVIPMIKYSD